MPELPEVETIVRQLRSCLIKKRLSRITIRDQKLLSSIAPRSFKKAISGKVINSVSRFGKFIIIELSSGLRVLIHLRMTGNLILQSCPYSPSIWDRVIFELNDGACLIFRDMRRLGRVYLEKTKQKSIVDELGPDALSPEFNRDYLLKKLKGRKVDIKSFLLDQTKVAGIGNIYAAEILYRVGINPQRPCSTITKREAEKIIKAARLILKKSISRRGTTFSTYRDAEDNVGGFQSVLNVYGQQGEPCPECGKKINRIVQKGRSTFFCPQCQR